MAARKSFPQKLLRLRDIDDVPLLSHTEVAMILGYTEDSTRQLLHRLKVPHYQTRSKTNLYPVEEVRRLLWKKGKRSSSWQKSPFLIMDLVEFFWRQNPGFPSKEDYVQDEMVFRKLRQITRLPQEERKKALREFFLQVEVAKEVVDNLPTPP